VLLVGFIGLLMARRAGAPFAEDLAWEREMMTGRTIVGVDIAMVLAVAGGTLVMSLLGAVLAVILFVLHRRRLAVALVATLLVSSGASSLLKVLVARPRPAGGLMRLSTFSFPSGHATTAAAIVVVLALAVRRAWSWTLATVWVVAIAGSRTYLGVHWLTDVGAGVVLGASVALLVSALLAVPPLVERLSAAET
jgi:undecaprenyl-diphosphatase